VPERVTAHLEQLEDDRIRLVDDGYELTENMIEILQMRRSNTRGHANSKSTDPDDYMGVYKRIETVPERYRLRNF